MYMKLKRLQKMSYFLHIALKILSISSVIMVISVVLMRLFSSKNVMINKLESDTIFYFQTELFVGFNTVCNSLYLSILSTPYLTMTNLTHLKFVFNRVIRYIL